MSNNTEPMVYVAADPNQPGAAWAAFVDDPTDAPNIKKDMAKEIAQWVRQGAEVQRVSVADARVMLSKWVRPEKKAKKAPPTQPGLFAA
jgi:anti-sigma factor ChrR (cupin superfamily)